MTSLLTLLQLSHGLVVAALIALAPIYAMAQPSKADATHALSCGTAARVEHAQPGPGASFAVLDSQQVDPGAALNSEAPELELEDDESAPPVATCAPVRLSPEPLASASAAVPDVWPSTCWVASPCRPSVHLRGPPLH